MTVFPPGSQARRLRHWEECRGPFTDLRDQDDELLATIAGLVIALPSDSEMGEKLRGRIGQRVAILRTDSEDYRCRFLDEEVHDADSR